jgi:hypothetical protein
VLQKQARRTPPSPGLSQKAHADGHGVPGPLVQAGTRMAASGASLMTLQEKPPFAQVHWMEGKPPSAEAPVRPWQSRAQV